MKKCCACKIEKQESNFFKLSRTKDGLTTTCKDCQNEKSRIWKEKNPEKLKAIWKRAREKKERIKKKGISWEEHNRKSREKYDANKEKISVRRKEKIRTPEIKKKAVLITTRYREKNREKYNEYQRNFRKKNSLYKRASEKVRYALQTGKLIKPLICEKCGENKPLQGHHEDYMKPLEVMWLCKTCHCKQHNKLMDIV